MGIFNLNQIENSGVIGKTVWFCDAETKTVKCGVVYHTYLGVGGYIQHTVISNGQKFTLETGRLFETEAAALENLPVFLDISEEMNKANEATLRFLETLREKIIGKPEFKELANEIYNQK